MSRHTLSVLVEDQPGVLARIAGLFSRRSFNIESLAVGPTEHAGVSRLFDPEDDAVPPIGCILDPLDVGTTSRQAKRFEADGNLTGLVDGHGSGEFSPGAGGPIHAEDGDLALIVGGARQVDRMKPTVQDRRPGLKPSSRGLDQRQFKSDWLRGHHGSAHMECGDVTPLFFVFLWSLLARKQKQKQ